MKKLLLVRPFANVMDTSNYNSQEIGLCKAFCKCGYDCDIVYFSYKDREEETFHTETNRVRVLWRKGIRFGSMAVFPEYLNPIKLWPYDIVISNEYDQVMSVLLSLLHANVFIYNGPYFNTFETDRKMRVYDFFCVPICNRRVKCVFSKTGDAALFLKKKGIKRILTVGVGVDTGKFDLCTDGKFFPEGRDSRKHNILYVGTAERRKRVGHIMKVFGTICREREDVRLIIVGNIERNDIKRFMKLIDSRYADRVVFLGKLENNRLGSVYKSADCTVLASDKEIFGMVILESMYFGVPCVASRVAGPETVIGHQADGILEDGYDVEQWKKDIVYLLDNEEIRKDMGRRAREKVLSDFVWDKIALKMLKKMEGGTES